MDGSPDIFLGRLERTINPILTVNRYKIPNFVPSNRNNKNDRFSNCDALYLEYLHALGNNCGDHIVKYDLYQEACNKLNASV